MLPLRLRLDADALVANWRTLDRLSGSAACGAAVKADGYADGYRRAFSDQGVARAAGKALPVNGACRWT